MRSDIPFHVIGVCTLAVALLFAACGGGKTPEVTVDERDGAELFALMERVQTAVKTENQEQFDSMFTSGASAKTIWKGLMNRKRKDGEQLLRLTNGPAIERVTTNVHVERLIIHTWYELATEFRDRIAVFHTTWSFARSEEEWKLSGLRIDSSTGAYGDLVRDFNRMDHFNFQALGMDWEGRVDPSPVVTRALRAIADGDLNRLKSCTVDGALFRAYEKRIEMPTIENGPYASGRYNRDSSADFLNGQIADFRKASKILDMDVDDLMPLINAYRITSMPRHCKKVKLVIDYGGERANTDVTSFSVSWTAAYIMQKWLAEVVGVEAIRSWG